MAKLKNKNLCILQARMGSTRLPGKVLMKVGGQAMLAYEIKRIRQAKKIDKIVVATSVNRLDDKIEKLCRQIGAACFRGSENDVLDRYYKCWLEYPQYDNIVRLTGDCPLIDSHVIDEVISFFAAGGYDYACNAARNEETFPDGLDVEIFKKSVLIEAAEKSELPSDREEVTEYIHRLKKFKKGNLSAPYDWSHFRLTVDEKADFEVIKFLAQKSKITDGYLHYISVLTSHPEIMFKNMHIKRNEGMIKAWQKDKIFLKNKI